MSPTGSSPSGDGGDDAAADPVESEQPERQATPPAPQPSEDLAGETLLGRYRLESRIGAGILGQIYRASRVDGGELVAIKVLDERHRPDPNVVRRFLREGEAARTLDHPCIARTFEAALDEKQRPFVCGELLDGEPVTSVVRAGPLTLRRIVEPICETLSALSEAHRQGILHRCLKPSNVLVKEDAEHHFVTKVRDFGMGRLLKAVPGTAATKYGAPCAAPEYMAPEQADSVEIDGRADVYATGVIFYELLTGQVPFSGATAAIVLGKHKNEPVVPPGKLRLDRRIPAVIEAVVMKALEKDPAQRYHSPREMRADLRRALDELGARADVPIEAPPEGAAGHPASRDRLTMPGEQLRSGQKLLIGAGLLLAVCSVLWMSAPQPDLHGFGANHVMFNSLREGQRLMELGDTAAALPLLQNAQTTLGDIPEVQRWLGEALILSGEVHAGRELLQAYLRSSDYPEDRRRVDALLESYPE